MTEHAGAETLHHRTCALRRHTAGVMAGGADPVLLPPVATEGDPADAFAAALAGQHRSLDALDALVVGRRVGRGGDAVDRAVDEAFNASDAAHLAVRSALASVRRAARLQDEAVSLVLLAQEPSGPR